MATPPHADLELRRDGTSRARLRIVALPTKRVPPIPPVVQLGEGEEPRELERIQLVEGCEYRYELASGEELDPSWWLEPSEIFSPDGVGATTGRVRPRLATGRLRIELRSDAGLHGQAFVEVRSVKLDYLDDYRWMLEDLVRFGTEVVLQDFAASEQRLVVDELLDGRSAYERFCFIRSILFGERVQGALARIRRSPHVGWVDEPTDVPSNRSLPAGRDVAKALMRGGPRVACGTRSDLASVPVRWHTRRFAETVDNLPNQFVRFVLEEWRHDVQALAPRLPRSDDDSATATRAHVEVDDVLAELDDALRAPLFTEVSRLESTVGANQVLQKRAGYREVLEAYVLSRFASKISWDASEDVFGGGQKNVATLYEYWVYLEILTCVRELAQGKLDVRGLFEGSAENPTLGLSRARTSYARTSVRVGADIVDIELAFNRVFKKSGTGESWTRTMRPDCTLELTPRGGSLHEPVRVHFDAKYRVEDLGELLGSDERDAAGEAHPDDLLKMHAYRDAIVRAAGAYVVYPGHKHERLRKHHEILPGLGAFALRPGPAGVTHGRTILKKFISDLVEHVSSQATQRLRARYWERAAHRSPPAAATEDHRHETVPWLTRPPADTNVLFGYVKSDRHLAWIMGSGLYNLRGDDRTGAVTRDSRELAVDVVVLYGPSLGAGTHVVRVAGSPRLLDQRAMEALGYPQPKSTAYFGIPIESAALDAPPWLDSGHVARVRACCGAPATVGRPLAATWAEILDAR